MATGVATALEIDGEDHMRPVTWEEWVTLPIREQDQAVHTVRGPIRMPTVIVLANFARVPKKRPKLCAKTIRDRDGNRCQYTGRLLEAEEGSIDHVVPVARWAGRVGKLRLVEQGGELEKGQPPAARSRSQTFARAEAGAGNAGDGTYPQRARNSRLGAVHSRIEGFGLTSSHGRPRGSGSAQEAEQV